MFKTPEWNFINKINYGTSRGGGGGHKYHFVIFKSSEIFSPLFTLVVWENFTRENYVVQVDFRVTLKKILPRVIFFSRISCHESNNEINNYLLLIKLFFN